MSALKNKKVIITDDSPVNLLITGKMLQMAGAQVLKANGGHETIALLNSHEDVGMVFLDLEMPEIDGFTTAQLIRKSGLAYADITMIALSAADDMFTREKAKDAGLDYYLCKPLSKQLVEEFANELSNSVNKQ